MNRWNKMRFILVNASFIPTAVGFVLATNWNPYTILVVLGYGMAISSNFMSIMAHVDKRNGYG